MTINLTVFGILALTQIVGWGLVSILPVLASEVAVDLGTSSPIVFMGTTVMFVVMGLAALPAGRAFRRFGARDVMITGAALIGCGLVFLARAHSIEIYLFSWAVIGAAGAMFLTTAAYVYLSDYAGARARGMIGSLMLVTGLAGTVFWPLTAYLDRHLGWRITVETYAAIMVLVVAPAMLGLPRAAGPRAPSGTSPSFSRGMVFWSLVAAIALNGFVTFGIEAIGISLFRKLGADPIWAVGLASSLGAIKVCGRLIDLVGGKRWNAMSTGVVAGGMVPVGLILLAISGLSAWVLAGGMLLFGIGSGAFAVARATMPLVFYRKDDYAAAMSSIALPMNLCTAFAAPVLSLFLTASGALTTISVLIFCSACALCLLVCLWRASRTIGEVRTSALAHRL